MSRHAARRAAFVASALAIAAATALAEGVPGTVPPEFPPTGLPPDIEVTVPEKKPTSAQYAMFERPTVEGAAVDHCTTWGQDCDGGGAQVYCKTVGHKRAVAWATYIAKHTFVIGSRRYCNADYCVGYSVVVCER